MGSFRTYLLNEALSTELAYLKKYLTMPEKDKNIERAHEEVWKLPDYLGIEIDDPPSKLEEMTDEEKAEFGEWLEGKIDASQSELPLFDMVEYEGVVLNQWLVHFSDEAFSIWKDQAFKKGTPHSDYSRLAVSTHFVPASKTGGWNFAFLADDADSLNASRYGKEGILFRGSGIKVWHYGDSETQVIFDGMSSNKPLIHIEKGEDEKWRINSTINGRKLIEDDSISSIANWVDRNYAQYRNHLT